jgi:hypothetical protein
MLTVINSYNFLTEDKIKLKIMRIPTSENELGVVFEYDYDRKTKKLGYFLSVNHSDYHHVNHYCKHKEMHHITYQEFKKLYPIFLGHNKRITK